MTKDELHAQLITPSGFAQARSALINYYNWFQHQTSLQSLPSIRKTGLEPQLVDPDWEVPKVLADHFGTREIKTLSLSVCEFEKPLVEVAISKRQPWVTLAVAAQDLPEQIGIDWTYPASVKFALNAANNLDVSELGKIFVVASRRSGAIISYHSIRAEYLRVRPQGASHQPMKKWPLLVDTCDEEVGLVG